MSKRIMVLVMSLCLILLASGCGNKTNSSSPSPSPSPTGSPQATKGTFAVNEYITLGQYKGVKVTVTKLEVTDEDVDSAIQDDLSANATQKDVTGRAIQNGDTVNIDFEGLKDGVAFEGGTSKGYELEIGSGSFIPGFEEGLVGHSVGEKVALNLTFPEDYQSTDLAGKAVVFNVTINSAKESVVPELTEDYVKSKTSFTSVAAYKDSIRKDLEAQNEETMKSQKTNDVFTAIVDSSKISSLPKTLLDYYSNYLKDYYTQYAVANGTDLAGFLAAQNMTEDDFNTETQQYAERMATQELVITAIVEAEKITLSDDEYNTGIDKLVSDYGYASKDDLLKTVDQAQIKETLLWQKAMDFVTAQAVEG